MRKQGLLPPDLKFEESNRWVASCWNQESQAVRDQYTLLAAEHQGPSYSYLVSFGASCTGHQLPEQLVDMVDDYTRMPDQWLLPFGNSQSAPAASLEAATFFVRRPSKVLEFSVHAGQRVQLAVMLVVNCRAGGVMVEAGMALHANDGLAVRVSRVPDASTPVLVTLRLVDVVDED
jgi:hypothetical protein